MKECAMEIQAVLNTLELLNMPSTYDNVNRMFGIYNTLAKVRDKLNNTVEAGQNGRETDSE